MARSVALLVHRTKLEAWNVAGQVIAWLLARNVAVRLDEETAHNLGLPALFAQEHDWNTVDFIVTLGGDGTLLTAARRAAPLGIPVLGVQMGNFGFNAETTPEGLYAHLERILAGEMPVQERLMVHCDVWRDNQRVHECAGLNDVIVKSALSELLHLKTMLGGEPFATYSADGIIVATPTGSTAYSLSAGGPVVEPTLRALLIVPICPHTLSARPLVVPGDETVEIQVESRGDVICAVDGVVQFPIQSGDRIVVSRADYLARLIVHDRAQFYRKVRRRYLYGERHTDAQDSQDA